MNKSCIICGALINTDIDVYLIVQVLQQNGYNDGQTQLDECICNQCPSDALTGVTIEKGNVAVHIEQIDPNEVR